MRRAFFGLMMMALTALAFAVPASAAQGQVTHYRSQGLFAEAFWATADTDTYLTGGTSKDGPYVMVNQFVTDPQTGNTTQTSVRGTGTFLIDQARLTAATLSATGLPGTTCTYDETGQQIGDCSSATIDVTASWTGEGPITRGVSNQHFKTGGFSMTEHFQGTFRDATATATITGLLAPLGDLQFADLGNTKQLDVELTIGASH